MPQIEKNSWQYRQKRDTVKRLLQESVRDEQSAGKEYSLLAARLDELGDTTGATQVRQIAIQELNHYNIIKDILKRI